LAPRTAAADSDLAARNRPGRVSRGEQERFAGDGAGLEGGVGVCWCPPTKGVARLDRV